MDINRGNRRKTRCLQNVALQQNIEDLIGGKSNQQNGYGTNEEKFRNNDHEKKTSIPWTYNEI